MIEDETNSLDLRIKRLKDDWQEKPTDVSNFGKDAGALGICIDLVAGILVGGFLGYFFDQTFHTTPIFLIICLLLGVIASNVLIYRKVKKLDKDG